MKARAAKPAAAPRGVAKRLEKYRTMRDFATTPEPSGTPPRAVSEALAFVVQKHAASHLHYDFRLELDGVLLSWSVPKGPSLQPGARRLAVRTEDHPIDYVDFEGIIPKGEYGGGTVIVWDRGSWEPDGDARQGLEKGKLTFTLRGDKLSGRFHLARTKLDAGKREHWLLLKGKDASARADSDIVSERPESALSGRTIEEVAKLPARVWHSNHTHAPAAKTTRAQPAHDGAPTTKTPAKKAASKAASKPTKRPGEAAVQQTDDAPADVIALVKRLPVKFQLTNLDKLLYPEQKVRKAEIIAYYAAVAAFALPHLGSRPLTLVRCPHGPLEACFFQKHASAGVPDAIKRVPIRDQSKTQDYMAVDDLAGLVAAAQLGALELHTWMCHVDDVERPDQLVFDLDPAEGVAWPLVVEGALTLRTRLADLGLESFVKTTGGKGLHVVVPVARKLDWEAHKDFAKAVSDALARERPDRYLTNMRKSLRKGRIFIDYLRNGRGATAIAPYSTRARPGATIATPLSWEELEAGVKPTDFTVYTVTRRLSALKEDPWRDCARLKQRISSKALASLGLR